MTKSLARAVITPLTTALFAVAAITGAMLFFHLDSGLVHTAHEWISLAFVLAALGHVLRNAKPILHYAKQKQALVAFGTGCAVSLALIALTANAGHGGDPGSVFRTLSQAKLEAVAPALGLTAEDAAAVLRSDGYEILEGQTLDEIGAKAGRNGRDVIMTLARPRHT